MIFSESALTFSLLDSMTVSVTVGVTVAVAVGRRGDDGVSWMGVGAATEGASEGGSEGATEGTVV